MLTTSPRLNGTSPPPCRHRSVRRPAGDRLGAGWGGGGTGKAGEIQQGRRRSEEEGRGVLVRIREPNRTAISQRVRAKLGGEGDPDFIGDELRDYGVGAQILLDLGVRDMILLSNTKRTIIGLEGYGLSIAEQRPIIIQDGGGGG